LPALAVQLAHMGQLRSASGSKARKMPTPGRRKPALHRYGLVGTNPVAVRVVAAAPVCSSANSGCAYRCRTDTVAAIPVPAIAAPIACAAHCDGTAAPRSSNGNRAAAVAAATPISATPAPSLGSIGDQAGGEQNDSGKRSENISEHDRNLSTNPLSPAREIAALLAREVDVDQRNFVRAQSVRASDIGLCAANRPANIDHYRKQIEPC
jgi:hypothetical protein